MKRTKVSSTKSKNKDLEFKNYIQTRSQSFNILFLIPHPFYQERGSPIADKMVLKVLSERQEHVDVVTYPEGQNPNLSNITIYRTAKIPLVTNIKPGFSWKKIIYDILILFKVIYLVYRKKYHLVHAVEETVFIALILKTVMNIPYVYDMDSSLVQQMIEKYSFLHRIKFILEWFERVAVRNAKAVIPVCQALADDIKKYRPKKVIVLPDISLL